MIVVLHDMASEGAIADVVEALTASGAQVNRHDGSATTITAAGGSPDRSALGTMPGVLRVLDDDAAPNILTPANVTGGFERGQARAFDLEGRAIGGGELFVAAGPCSVEDEETMNEVAGAVAAAGAVALRGGAWKPRSNPYSFPGFGEEGLLVLRRAADAHGLLVVSEVMDASQIAMASRYCDVLQVGARNMHNSSLLRELGRARKAVLLKRGLSATVEEWVQAAEFIASSGNQRVILCERGIRTFETATRNTLDLGGAAVAADRTGLPVVVDPSHGVGLRRQVPAMARAAVAAGADGLLVEVHPRPDEALSDSRQTIDTGAFARTMADVRAIRLALAQGC